MSITWEQMCASSIARKNGFINIASDNELCSLIQKKIIPAVEQPETKMKAITNILNDNKDIVRFCHDVVMNIYEINKSYFDTNATVITWEMICLYVKAVVARIIMLSRLVKENLINFKVRSFYTIHYDTYLEWLMNETSIEMEDKNVYSGNHIQLRLGIDGLDCGYDIEIAPKDIWKMDLNGPQDLSLIKKNLENYKVQYDIDYLNNKHYHVDTDYCLLKDLVKTIKDKIIKDFSKRK